MRHDLSFSWFPILSFDVWVCVFLIFIFFPFFFQEQPDGVWHGDGAGPRG